MEKSGKTKRFEFVRRQFAPVSTTTAFNSIAPLLIREEQFKIGHLLAEFIRLIHGNQSDVAGELQTSIVRYQEKSPNQLFNRKLQAMLLCIVRIGLYYRLNIFLWMPMPAFVPLITYLTYSRNGPNAHDIDKLEEMFKLGFLNYYVEHSMFSAASQPVYEYSADYEGDSYFTSKAVIIRERNILTIEVLKKIIAEGKMSIAILYGVGHMADFHKRLVKELDMVPVTVEWYSAWFIKEGPKSKLIHPLLDKFQREDRTFILGTLNFSFHVADLCAWRTAFGLHYWVASWVFRFSYFFSKRRKGRLEKLQHSISF